MPARSEIFARQRGGSNAPNSRTLTVVNNSNRLGLTREQSLTPRNPLRTTGMYSNLSTRTVKNSPISGRTFRL